MTVAEIRQKNIIKLAERSTNKDGQEIERARKAFNSFYRLAGFSERLFYINNDSVLYDRYTRRGRLAEMEAREDTWIKRINGYLKEFNVIVYYNGVYPSIVEQDEGGRVNDLFLTSWYN